jgi:hypothetical protein
MFSSPDKHQQRLLFFKLCAPIPDRVPSVRGASGMGRSHTAHCGTALLLVLLLVQAGAAQPTGDPWLPTALEAQLPQPDGDPGGLPDRRPGPLDRPLESPPAPPEPAAEPETTTIFRTPLDAPLGFTGPSGVLPREAQHDSQFVPRQDRWRIGFPEWDRYDKGHPRLDDYPYVPGHWWDPFNQNVLKGDYPIIGQNTFLEITATSRSVIEPRQVPTATTPFESTARPSEEEFFGRPNQLSYAQFFLLSLDLFHGDAAFRPVDWRVKVTPVFNVNALGVEELAVVNPDVTRGRFRGRSWFALEEWFVESKLADLSPDYDFLSVRAGSQPFTSDFRGFIFSDTNRAVRLFGNRLSNRDQFNVILFRPLEKDTNSELNTFHERHQTVLIANYYRQDFLWPGYTAQWSVHYNHDEPTFHFDQNSVLVRPDPVGCFSRTASTSPTWAGPATGTSTASTSVTPFTGRWAATASTRWPTSTRTSTPRWRRWNCPTTATGCASARRSSGPPATRTRTTATPPASTPSSTTRTSPAANSATGSGRRSGCSAST